ncbi:zinc finger and SCAN domain-containing protein 31-like [Cheilinus undulatus]|uniref:zinc finger and SCAN domain-containing protein 31-like n=1 Tax=Cheilinus undulatus TaxID=241271 RepID=UPI001BD65565|nr:zinc finger and SCAN domain-containing protein 31-like [Cheilinus undulatus]
MSNVQNLRSLVNQRLNAAVEEVFELIERTIADYEEQLRASKEENHRHQQQLLDAIQLKKEDVQQPMVENEEVPPERQNWSLRVKQEFSEPMHIKEEPEEPWCSQDPQGAKEAFPDAFKLARVRVKSEEDDKMEAQSSQIPENQSEENKDTEHLKTDSHEEDFGGSELVRDVHAETHLHSDASDKTSHSSDSDTDDSDNWKDSGKSYLGPRSYRRLDSLERKEIAAGEGNSNTGTTSASLSAENQEKQQGPPFKCKVCGNNFPKKVNFQQHMLRHTKEKSFACPVCKKGFIWKAERERHMKTHTGEKPFCCQVCSQSFARLNYLRKHALIHSGEKPYSCDDCGKKFTWQQGLSKHKCVKKRKKRSSKK